MSESKLPTQVGSLAVDTSAVVSLFRGQKEALDRFNRAQEVWMPVTVLGELYCRLCYAMRQEMPLLARDDHFGRIDGLDLIAL